MTGHPTEMLGGKFLLYVNTSGDDDNPTWTKIGGQQKGTFARTADVIKAQHKDSFPWYRKLSGFIQWTFDFDGVWIIDSDTGIQDEGIRFMQECWSNSLEVYVQVVTPMYEQEAGKGSTYTGHAIIADFGLDGPHDNLITYTGKLEGNGEYLYVE